MDSDLWVVIADPALENGSHTKTLGMKEKKQFQFALEIGSGIEPQSSHFWGKYNGRPSRKEGLSIPEERYRYATPREGERSCGVST